MSKKKAGPRDNVGREAKEKKKISVSMAQGGRFPFQMMSLSIERVMFLEAGPLYSYGMKRTLR